jgi:hypothetical protein
MTLLAPPRATEVSYTDKGSTMNCYHMPIIPILINLYIIPLRPL